jgi:hypothetical protein
MSSFNLRAFFRSNLGKTILGSLGFLLSYLVLIQIMGGVQNNLGQLGLDFLFCAGGFVFWIIFFAQFTLPLRTTSDRSRSVVRLIDYLGGFHGPAIFIENGEIIERKGETNKYGSGVVLLDTASGALLRTPVAYTRAVGPGITFTDPGEYIAGTVDLHIQNKRIGPRGNENPFTPKGQHEDPAVYEQRQIRRNETSGLTRDGIEVVPNISITFRLDARPGEGNTQFGYREEAVYRAIVGRAVDLSKPADSSDRLIDWKLLPVLLAADIWRETLSKFTFSELYQPGPGHPEALKVIQDIVRNRLKNASALALDNYGNSTQLDQPSHEYQILTQRGLKVISANITNLRFPAEVEMELVQHWKATWLERAQLEQQEVDKQRSYMIDLGHKQGRIEYLEGITHYFSANNHNNSLEGKAILKQLLEGHIYLCNRDPMLHKKVTGEISELRELISWVDQFPEES